MSDENQGELAVHDWLKNKTTQAVMMALGGDRGEARFVGGCVRNALLMEPVSDIDIATIHAPAEATRLLEAEGVKVVPTGFEHGTVTAVLEGMHFEVTTLRVDVATDGRRADVAYTGDWVEDAKRRDFTMNALYADLDGRVHDPLGGRDDLTARLVRFIGDPHDRIREDYLRVLRFFRFHAHYGTGEPDAAGLKACAEEKEGLAQLSAERVHTELLKLLGADGASAALRQMAATGLLSFVLPEATRLDRLEALVDIEANQLFTSDPVLRLSSAVELDGAGVEVLAARLKLSKKDRDRIRAMQTDETKIVCYLSVREVHKALYLMGVQCFKDRVMFGWATDRKGANAMQWRALLAIADSWVRPKLLLNGSMMKAAGVPEGPEMSRVYGEVEEWWVDAGFIDDEFSIIERLKAVVQATVY
jgi:poly(A) polymerase